MIRKPAGRPLGDTEYLLEQWGCWRMDGAGALGYTSPTLALMRQVQPQIQAHRNYAITDEWAIAVDGAVARLTRRDQQMGDMVWLYFGSKWPMARVGKHYGVSEGKARELVRAGVAWVDCVVSQDTKAP
ncbi:antitermination protein Q [Pseudomonas lundensis]|nr:antitermination protein Q [Pseudomonas lundensis]